MNNNENEIIRLDRLGKTYEGKNGQVQALKAIDLVVNEGDIFGIIGLSGAGKSTLVRCMNLLEKPTTGKVLFRGEDLVKLSKKELNNRRHEISMIFQGFNLLMQRNVIQNVCFPLELQGVDKSKAREKAMKLLKLVDLEERANAYPSQLSGGQKQRVAIARALATDPKVILCDEATSALDPKTTKSILELLKEINSKLGITVVIITHEMRVIQEICHKVAIIDEGIIAEQGLVDEIFTSPKTVAAKRLIMPEESSGVLLNDIGNLSKESPVVRIVFDGSSAYQPIISNMILKYGEPINILYGNMQLVEEHTKGQLVIQLSSNEEIWKKQLDYLEESGVKYSIEKGGYNV